jgi:hypothetical protein
MSSMLASARAFRALFVYGLIALAVALAGVVAASAADSSAGVLVALVVAEATLAGVIWFLGWPRLRATAAGTAS